MFKKFWDEFKLVFNDPREIHRVLVVIPLAALFSHFVYLYIKMPMGVPIDKDQKITMALVLFLYFMLTAWVFLSNKTTPELFMRFLWSGLLAVLGHRIGVMDGETGGSLFFKALSFFAIGTIMIFVVTGKTKNEIMQWIREKLAEKKNEKSAKIYALNSDDDDQQSSTG